MSMDPLEVESSLERIRKALAHCGYEHFYFNIHNLKEPPTNRHMSFAAQCLSQIDIDNASDRSISKMTLSPMGDAKPYNLDDLLKITSNFSQRNLVRETIHGKLFKGFVEGKRVMVKTWDFSYPFQERYIDHPYRFYNELDMLTMRKPYSRGLLKMKGVGFQNTLAVRYADNEAKVLLYAPPQSRLVKVQGFCCQNKLAIVYDEIPTAKFLSQKIFYAEDFAWNNRLKVTTQLAGLFAWLHEKEFSFGFVRPSTIIIDKDFNVKVFDFGFLANKDSRLHAHSRYCITAPEHPHGAWTLRSDVFMFGLLLVDLFANKRNRCMKENWILYHFAVKEFPNVLVDRTIVQSDDEQAKRIEELIGKCLTIDPAERPDMNQVIDHLNHLWPEQEEQV